MYPEIAQTMGNRKSVVFKVTMSVFAKSMDAKDDLRAFVWDFGQEHNQVSLLLLVLSPTRYSLNTQIFYIQLKVTLALKISA